MDQSIISVLSLVVAGLAVFVGPLASWFITRRQLDAADRLAQRQLITPMRQAWINELRQKFAELIAVSLHYFVAGYEDRSDAEYRRLGLLEQEVALMLSPDMDDTHQLMLNTIGQMTGALGQGQVGEGQFMNAHNQVTNLARQILRAEWRRVKTGA